MQDLPKGGNTPITSDLAQVKLNVSVGTSCAFLIGADGRSVGAGAICEASGKAPGVVRSTSLATHEYECNLGALPAGTERVVFAAFAEGSGEVQGIEMSLLDVARYIPESADATGQVILVGELYLRKGAWKFRALGQPQDGNIKAVATNFGVTFPAAVPAPPAAGTRGSSTSLSKITLEKKGDHRTISLKKEDREIVINLNWNQRTQKKGLFGFKKDTEIDLDLGCFIELQSGPKFGSPAPLVEAAMA